MKFAKGIWRRTGIMSSRSAQRITFAKHVYLRTQQVCRFASERRVSRADVEIGSCRKISYSLLSFPFSTAPSATCQECGGEKPPLPVGLQPRSSGY